MKYQCLLHFNSSADEYVLGGITTLGYGEHLHQSEIDLFHHGEIPRYLLLTLDDVAVSWQQQLDLQR